MTRPIRPAVRNLAVAALSAAGLVSIVVSGGGGGNPITATLTPMAITMARENSYALLPENCNDNWDPGWLSPQQWWNSIVPTHSPKVVGDAVVGFEILRSTNAGGSCSKMRQDLYRAGFTYDLSQSQNLKGLV